MSIEALLEENFKQKELREKRRREKEEKERIRREALSVKKEQLMKTKGFAAAPPSALATQRVVLLSRAAVCCNEEMRSAT